jgi:hypothetical protein
VAVEGRGADNIIEIAVIAVIIVTAVMVILVWSGPRPGAAWERAWLVASAIGRRGVSITRAFCAPLARRRLWVSSDWLIDLAYRL